MTRTEKNEAIAKILGFEEYYINADSPNQMKAWIVPEEWNWMQRAVPQWSAPDFMGYIEILKKIKDSIGYAL